MSSLLLLEACEKTPMQTRSSENPLRFNETEVNRAETVAFFIPGALAPIDIFDEAKVWRERFGYALVYYRFPGLDDLPLDHNLEIESAANAIAAFAKRYPRKRFRIVGYSTGGPIGVLAASKLPGDVRVAAISPAVERAGGIGTAARGSADVAAAALRAGSLNRAEIWREYYRTLLFGRAGLKDEELIPIIDTLAETEKNNIVIPYAKLSNAHMNDLKKWVIPEGFRIDPKHVRFYVGQEDPVFSIAQTQKFAEQLGGIEITQYPRDGHLLFLTRPSVFEDIAAFFEGG